MTADTTAADDAWQALNAALDEYAPECEDWELFTADTITVPEQALAESICARCRVSDLCDAFATASKPMVGFWAGFRWTQQGKQPAGPRPTRSRRKQAAG